MAIEMPSSRLPLKHINKKNDFSKIFYLKRGGGTLKQFHLYTKLPSGRYNKNVDLSQFKDQYWFNHNPSFGMHGDYVYTLPFHFDNLYDCFQDFNEIKLNNCEILKRNSRIWYNVKSIQLPTESNYNRNFVKELNKNAKVNFN
jgi:hypothetical protein